MVLRIRYQARHVIGGALSAHWACGVGVEDERRSRPEYVVDSGGGYSHTASPSEANRDTLPCAISSQYVVHAKRPFARAPVGWVSEVFLGGSFQIMSDPPGTA